MSIKRSKKSVKSSKTYYCDVCNYTASQKSHYDKHLSSKKHQKNCDQKCPKQINSDQISKTLIFCSNCDKKYNTKSGWYRHIKKCKFKDTVTHQKVAKTENENPYLEITKLNNQINEMKDKEIIYLQNKLEQTSQQNQQLTDMCAEFAKNKAIH